MIKSLAVYAILASLFQAYLFLDRGDIINEYQPILIEIANNFSEEFEIFTKEYTLAIEQTKNNTFNGVALVNKQIANLKADIASARNISDGNTQVLTCIARQDDAVAKLTAASINATCWVGETHPDLDAASNAFKTLAAIPNATITACGTLDPLPTQDELFLECIADKILDLNQQGDGLKVNFEVARLEFIQSNVACVENESAAVSLQINEINFQVTLCLSLG